LTSAQAAKGLKITVPHMDGRQVTVQVTAGDVRHNGTKVIQGEGMPIRKKPGSKGDMRVIYDVAPPAPDFR
jgi:DnaJ family protein A protein 2